MKEKRKHIMCKCMNCDRTLEQLLPDNLTNVDNEVPLLYLGTGALPICIRCATEHAIGVLLYGLPIYVYDKKDKIYKATEPEFEDIRTSSELDSKHNLVLYRKVFRRTEKPQRCHL